MAQGKASLKPADLVGTTWISTHAGFSPTDMLDAVAAAAGYPMRVVHRINDFSTAAAMVSEGGHLALLPRHTVSIPASQDGVLRPLRRRANSSSRGHAGPTRTGGPQGCNRCH
ncbi:hypothetical protein CQ020_17020 [Arthrobacter sp. MYb23]|uniref:LysR family transcriptional regulator substrate-binding protein n=1 Tax=unclassified Arthrobacter TaxID=235627 RepID=UPI000CFCB95F|nr:hypothetical protein CQ038_07535 [Arthrobacter sp. MYb51]PRB93720.1 hypothetical protein CQ020_17020 [Arthrobacter sp. MYb23]